MDIWEIDWNDSTGSKGWFNKQEVNDELLSCPCRSVGYLVSVTRRGLILAFGYNETSYLDPVAIPRGAVVRARRLSKGE